MFRKTQDAEQDLSCRRWTESARLYFPERGFSDPDSSPTPNFILLDLRLPRVDGLEVLRQLKDNVWTRKTPVVILTTSSADRDIAMSYEYHANSYVVKPMDFSKFESLMQDIGYYWLDSNQNPAS